MTDTWRTKILKRRAGFVAAAIASTAPACDKDKPQDGSAAPSASAELGERPTPCLRPMIGPASSSTFEPGKDYPFQVDRGGTPVASGSVRVTVEGGNVPHAAHVGAGRHMQARLRSCFLEAADRKESPEGELTITLELKSDGTVAKSTADAKGSITEQVRDCAAEQAGKVGFNPVEGGGTAKVLVHLTLAKP